jgi:SET domain-containing protein
MELYIAETEKGRGVFCNADLHPGDEIEVCPVLVLPGADREHIDKTHLYNYYFLWGEDHQQTGIALGYGSLYNHSYQPNAVYETYYEEQLMKIICLSFIPAHTEITINYNHDPDDRSALWFDAS